jgi:hypothetical protein
MNQIDDKLIELINAEIDGELSDEERNQLQQQLVKNPDARAMHKDLLQLNRALAPLGNLSPPGQIRENILNAVAPNNRSFITRLIEALLPTTAIPRYALAFVGGIVFGFGALQLGDGYRTDMDSGQFVGTMTDYGSLPDAISADDISLELEQISGSVRMHQIGSMLIVEFDMNSQNAVKVVTEYRGSSIEFRGFSLKENELSSFVAYNESINLIAKGNHRYSVFLQKRQPGETSINIRFLADGEIFHVDSLKSPAVD